MHLVYWHWPVLSLYLSYDQVTALNVALQSFLFSPIISIFLFLFTDNFQNDILLTDFIFHLINFNFLQLQTFPIVPIHLLRTIYAQSYVFENYNNACLASSYTLLIITWTYISLCTLLRMPYQGAGIGMCSTMNHLFREVYRTKRVFAVLEVITGAPNIVSARTDVSTLLRYPQSVTAVTTSNVKHVGQREI